MGNVKSIEISCPVAPLTLNSAAAPAKYLLTVFGIPGNTAPKTRSLLTVIVCAESPKLFRETKPIQSANALIARDNLSSASDNKVMSIPGIGYGQNY